MTKQFKVGDKVRVVKGHFLYNVGDTFEIARVDSSGDVFDSEGICVHPYKVEKLSEKPTKNQRISALESEVATLTRRIEALEQGKSYAHTPRISVEAVKPLTPNQQASANSLRKAIIDEAKAFIEDAMSRNYPYVTEDGVWFSRQGGYFITDKVEFVINAEKRTVVAIIRDVDTNEVRAKAIAKCAPDDVFNADIGKAIALGRALGLDVGKFEQAVKPTEVVVGQKVFCGESSYPTARSGVHTVKRVPKEGFERGGAFVDAFNRDRNDRLTWVELKYLTVKDDTEAQYV